MNFRILAHAVLTEGFLTQVHNFLGSSSTFYRHNWESKDCLPAFKIFTQYWCFVSSTESKDWASRAIRILDSLFRARNQIPSQRESRRNHQIFVAHNSSIGQSNLIVLRLKGFYSRRHPPSTWTSPEHISLITNNILRLFTFCLCSIANYASSNKRISRLVMMFLSRVKDGNFMTLDCSGSDKLWSYAKASGARTNNSNLSMHAWEGSLKVFNHFNNIIINQTASFTIALITPFFAILLS